MEKETVAPWRRLSPPIIITRPLLSFLFNLPLCLSLSFLPLPSLPPSHPSSVVSQPSLSHTATRCTSGKISSPARTTEEASAALQPGPTPSQLETSTSPETPPPSQLPAPGWSWRTARLVPCVLRPPCGQDRTYIGCLQP